MADTKISALPASTTPLAGTEVLPVVQSGTTKQVSVANLTTGRPLSATELTLSTGNLVIGTSGRGIDFSATPGTGTSELLSDYEEGTWTPTDASGAGLSFTLGTCTYTKIGRQVTANFDITYPSTADATTQLMGGLPFTASSGAANGGFVSYTTFANGLSLMVAGSSTTVSFRRWSDGSNNTNAAYSTKVIRGTLVYFV